ncbi:MAG: hypothetical protein JWO78_436 [Micavibrio sp.]|nr:hypothetical protein [Micavibrio sp.]
MLSYDLYLKEGAARLAEKFNPATTAHIAVDVHDLYLSPAIPIHRKSNDVKSYFERAAALTGRLAGFADNLRQAGIQNIWIRHDVRLKEHDFETGILTGSSAEKMAKLSEYKVRSMKLSVPFDAEKDALVDKIGFNAFLRTGLAENLHEKKIKTVFISGGRQEICVSATAFGATQAGFNTFIVDDLLFETNPLSILDRDVFYEDRADNNIYVVTTPHVQALLKPAP